MFEIVQVTAQYSNAVLLAIMPHISDFSKKLDLPIPQPVTTNQVLEFKCSSRADLFGGRVILTNGYEFAFVHGHVEMYRTPQSLYELQDPDKIPKLFGPVKLSEKEAVAVAHKAIKNLGYTDQMLFVDRPPKITRPPQIGKNYVPRYRIWWGNLNEGTPENTPTSVDVEVDATTGQIQMMYLLNPATFKESPKVDVHPPVTKGNVENKYRGGRQMTPVSQAYSNAFLNAVLPQITDYVKTAGFPIPVPVSTNDVNMSKYICSLVDDDPMAVVDLKSGARFIYRHGQVIAFYGPDVFTLPGEDQTRPVKDFYGPVNMTGGEAIKLVKQTLTRLGYSEKTLHIDEAPLVNEPTKRNAGTIARYYLNWKESQAGAFRVVAEVDASKKQITSLYVNDHAITNIWRKPPELSLPVQK